MGRPVKTYRWLPDHWTEDKSEKVGKSGKIYKWLASKRRGEMMATDVKQFELDRIVNLVKSFGWNVISSRFDEDKIKVELEKKVVAEVKG